LLEPVATCLRAGAGPRRAGVRVAGVGGGRLEDRPQALHGVGAAADHQAEADLEPPDAARDAGIDEVKAALLRLRVPPLRVAEVAVAAVDDRVPLVGEAEQTLEHVLRDLSRGPHHPEGPRPAGLLP